MGFFTAKHIIDRVSFILKDPENVRWNREVLLDYVNEAQAAVVRLQPQSNQVRKTINLVEGTLQRLPEDTINLLTVSRNIENGKPGKAIRLATRSLFDAMFDDWHDEEEQPEVENYIYDDRTGDEFEVFPPNDGTGVVEIVYSALPPIIGEEDKLSLSDQYATVITNYVLYKSALLDSDFNGTQGLAQYYYQLFMTELVGQDKSAAESGPHPAMNVVPVAPNGGTE